LDPRHPENCLCSQSVAAPAPNVTAYPDLLFRQARSSVRVTARRRDGVSVGDVEIVGAEAREARGDVQRRENLTVGDRILLRDR
jgi:hypothetical protein